MEKGAAWVTLLSPWSWGSGRAQMERSSPRSVQDTGIAGKQRPCE